MIIIIIIIIINFTNYLYYCHEFTISQFLVNSIQSLRHIVLCFVLVAYYPDLDILNHFFLINLWVLLYCPF